MRRLQEDLRRAYEAARPALKQRRPGAWLGLSLHAQDRLLRVAYVAVAAVATYKASELLAVYQNPLVVVPVLGLAAIALRFGVEGVFSRALHARQDFETLLRAVRAGVPLPAQTRATLRPLLEDLRRGTREWRDVEALNALEAPAHTTDPVEGQNR
ncbi:MAG: hypothetical protein IT371_16620 [Deltaproteobacteria bacterium]|nr:hypothetical protein [Deltaproteobacteria bacterium]